MTKENDATKEKGYSIDNIKALLFDINPEHPTAKEVALFLLSMIKEKEKKND